MAQTQFILSAGPHEVVLSANSKKSAIEIAKTLDPQYKNLSWTAEVYKQNKTLTGKISH